MVARMYDMPARSMRDRVSPEEWEARVELACAYRVAWHHGWYSQIFNHISYKIPGTNEEFLLNPLGFLYREITASSLVKIDLEGNTLDGSPHGVIQAGWVIHSAIHKARPDVKCIIHTHSRDGIARIPCSYGQKIPNTCWHSACSMGLMAGCSFLPCAAAACTGLVAVAVNAVALIWELAWMDFLTVRAI